MGHPLECLCPFEITKHPEEGEYRVKVLPILWSNYWNDVIEYAHGLHQYGGRFEEAHMTMTQEPDGHSVLRVSVYLDEINKRRLEQFLEFAWCRYLQHFE